MLSLVEYRDGKYITLPVSSVATFYRAVKQGYSLIDRRSETLEALETNKAELGRSIKLEGSCLRHLMPLSQCSYCYEELTKTKELKDYVKKLNRRLQGQEYRLLQIMTDSFDWANSEQKPSWITKSMWEKTLEAAGKCGGKIYNTLRERFAEWAKARESLPSQIAREEKVKIFSGRDNSHPVHKFNPFVERLTYEGFRRVEKQIETLEKKLGEIRHLKPVETGSDEMRLHSVTELHGEERIVSETESQILPDSLNYDDEVKALTSRPREDSQKYATRIQRVYGIRIVKPTVTHVAKSESPTERLVVRTNFRVKKESE
jgi:hypothetical protein